MACSPQKMGEFKGTLDLSGLSYLFLGVLGAPELQKSGLLDIKISKIFLWPIWPLSKIGGD